MKIRKCHNLFIILILLIGCNGHYKTKKVVNEINLKEPSKENMPITKDSFPESDQPDMANILKSYLDNYGDTVRIDTSYTYGIDTIKFRFKHYCIYDSALNVPQKYIQMYGLKKFITHDFVSNIEMTINNVNVLDTTITKFIFAKYLDSNLMRNGALLYPDVNFQKDTIKINYSISIPLSDVGVGVVLIITDNGRTYTGLNQY